MAASGGTPVPVTVLDESRKERSHRLPQFLPDGKHFLFLVQAPDGTPDTDGGFAIFAASLDSTDKTPIVATRSSARYASSGHLLFVRDRTLVVMLRSSYDHPRVSVRFDVTQELLEREGVATETVEGRGDSRLAHVLSLVHFGDYVSYYLAMLNGANPSPVETIVYLKGRLAEAESGS